MIVSWFSLSVLMLFSRSKGSEYGEDREDKPLWRFDRCRERESLGMRSTY